MSIKIDIFDGSEEYFDKIMQLSYYTALESLSVAGSIVQKNTRNRMGQAGHHWFQYLTEKGTIGIRKNSNSMRELGLRINRENARPASPSSMQSMITSFMMVKSMTVVVGGKHPAFTPTKYRDGKPAGVMKRVKGVSKSTHAILHKLNTGRLNEEYERESIESFKGSKYTANDFMGRGYNASKGAIREALTKRYVKLLHGNIEKVNVTIKKRKAV